MSTPSSRMWLINVRLFSGAFKEMKLALAPPILATVEPEPR
jgi:hypothetical protein